MIFTIISYYDGTRDTYELRIGIELKNFMVQFPFWRNPPEQNRPMRLRIPVTHCRVSFSGGIHSPLETLCPLGDFNPSN